MERIILKHWTILTKDPKLKSAIPPRLRFVYKKAPSIKNSIAPSKLKRKIPANSRDVPVHKEALQNVSICASSS